MSFMDPIPPDYEQPVQQQAPEPDFLQRLAMALQQIQAPEPQNFGQGLMTGFVQGFAGKHAQEADRQRQQVEQSNARASEAAKEMNRRRWEIFQAQNKSKLDAAAKAAEFTAQQKTPQQIQDESYNRERGSRLAQKEVPIPVQDRNTFAQERFNATHEPDPLHAGKMRPVGTGTNALNSLGDDARQDKDISNFIDVRDGYDRVQAGARLNNAQGDLSLIFGYMKILDPGSVVREGEYANAANTAGIPDRVRKAYNKAIDGSKLSPQQRVQFTRAAESMYQAKKPSYDRAIQFHSGRAQAMGVDPKHVIRDYSANTSQAAPAPQGGTVRMRAPNGEEFPVPRDQVEHYKRKGAIVVKK